MVLKNIIGCIGTFWQFGCLFFISAWSGFVRTEKSALDWNDEDGRERRGRRAAEDRSQEARQRRESILQATRQVVTFNMFCLMLQVFCCLLSYLFPYFFQSYFLFTQGGYLVCEWAGAVAVTLLLRPRYVWQPSPQLTEQERMEDDPAFREIMELERAQAAREAAREAAATEAWWARLEAARQAARAPMAPADAPVVLTHSERHADVPVGPLLDAGKGGMFARAA